MPHLPKRRALLVGIPAIVLATGVAVGLFSQSAPGDLDLALSKPTASGLYLAALAPVAEPVTVGSMHSWTVSLTDAAGAPVEAASIDVDGGMPRHVHGLPTAPAVMRSLGEGKFLIEGMTFNMSGWWEIDLSIDSAAGADTVTFNLVL